MKETYFEGQVIREQKIQSEMQITLKRNASSATAELLFHF